MSRAVSAWAGRLRRSGQLRVWSLLATVFGDIVEAHGGRATPAALQEIVADLGVGNGALRTAISRLGRDGWIRRQRMGKTVWVSLSADAAGESRQASDAIYSDRAREIGGQLHVAIAPRKRGRSGASEESGLAGRWTAEIAPGVRLRMTDGPAEPESALIAEFAGGRLPGWVLERLGAPTLARGMDRLCKDVALVEEAARLSGCGPEPALAARVLLIHQWRRIVLRLPPLPASAMPADWPEVACRASVARLYRRLASPSLVRLSVVAGLGAPDSAILATRFGSLAVGPENR